METSIKREQWYTLSDGENILLVAQRAGFRNWRTLFNHDKNDAFREKNPDPTVVHTGDQVWIPEITPHKGFVCEADEQYTFVVRSPKMPINFVFFDEDDIPFDNVRYEIWIDDNKYGTQERRMTAQGEVIAEVPIVSELTLLVWKDGEDEEADTYTISTGDLDPISTIEGVQDRLNNLGYLIKEEEEGILGPNTIAALKDFQADSNLPITGEIDDATRLKLNEKSSLIDSLDIN